MSLGRDAADATDFVFATGPVRHNLDGVDAETVARLRAEVLVRFREFESPEGVTLRRTDRLIAATRRGRAEDASRG